MMDGGGESKGQNDEGEFPSDTAHVSSKPVAIMDNPMQLSCQQEETKNDSKLKPLPRSQETSTNLDDEKPSAVATADATASRTVTGNKTMTGSSSSPREDQRLKKDKKDGAEKEAIRGEKKDDAVLEETDSKIDDSNNSDTSAGLPSGTGSTKHNRKKVNKKAKTLTQTLSMTKKMSKAGSSISIKPEETDVLCGRGKPFQSWPGNLRLHRIVSRNKAHYLKSRRYDKLAISERVVHEIKTGGDGLKPGRFLRRKEGRSDEGWEIATDSVAREKVSHALRGRPKRPDGVSPVPNEPASSMSMPFPLGTMALPTSGVSAGLGGSAKIPHRETLSAGVSFGSLLSNPISGSGSGSGSTGTTSISFPQLLQNSIASSTESSVGSQSSGSNRPNSDLLREYQLQQLYTERERVLADRLIRLQQQSGDLGQGLSAPAAFQQELLRQDQQRLLLLQGQQALLGTQQAGSARSFLHGNISDVLLGLPQSFGSPSSILSTTPQILHAISSRSQNHYPGHSLQLAADRSQSINAHDQLSRALALQGTLGSGISGVSQLDDQIHSLSTTSTAGLSNQSRTPGAALHNMNQLSFPNQNFSMMLNDNSTLAAMAPNRPLTLEMLLGNHGGQGTTLQRSDRVDVNQGRSREDELRRHQPNNKKH